MFQISLIRAIVLKKTEQIQKMWSTQKKLIMDASEVETKEKTVIYQKTVNNRSHRKIENWPGTQSIFLKGIIIVHISKDLSKNSELLYFNTF